MKYSKSKSWMFCLKNVRKERINLVNADVTMVKLKCCTSSDLNVDFFAFHLMLSAAKCASLFDVVLP